MIREVTQAEHRTSEISQNGDPAGKFEAPAALASVAATLAISLHWYRPGQMIGEVDLFPNYGPLTLLRKTFFAWSHATSPFGSYDLPTFTTYYGLQHLFTILTNPETAQILLFWVVMATAWLGVFALCRSLRLGVVPSLCAAWTYVLNPYEQFLIPWITGGAFAAALPWVFWMLHMGATYPRSRRRITAIAAGATLTVLPWVASTPQLFFELLLLAAVWWLFLLRRSGKEFARWTAWSCAACIAAGSWWAVPEIFGLFGNSIGHTTATAGVAWSFSYSSLLNNLRFINVWTWAKPSYLPYAGAYDASVATYAAGFFGAAVLCVSMLTRKTSSITTVRFFAALALICAFIAKGPHPPLAGVNELIYKLPGFFLLFEAGGITVGQLLSVCLLAAILAQHFLEAQGEQQWYRAPALLSFMALATAAAILSASPVLNGFIFSARTGTNGPSNYFSIPAYWREAGAFLNASHSPGSVLVLPADTSYQARYNWGYEGVDLIPADLINRASLLLGPSLDYFVDPRIESIKRRIRGMIATRSDATASVLHDIGVRYVLCRTDVQEEYIQPDCGLSFLRRRAKVERFGEISIYDLGAARGEFAAWTYLFTGRYASTVDAGDFLEMRARLGNAPRIAEAAGSPATSVSVEKRVTCSESCASGSAADAFVMSTSAPATLGLDSARSIVIAFDDPLRQTLETFNGLFPQKTLLAHAQVLPTVQSIVVPRPHLFSIYLFNPSSTSIRRSITARLRFEANAVRRCVTAVFSPGEPRWACARGGSNAVALGELRLAPGESNVFLTGPVGSLTAQDFQFSAGPLTGTTKWLSPRSLIMSPGFPHAVEYVSSARVSLSAQPVIDSAFAAPLGVNVGYSLLLAYRNRTYLCYGRDQRPLSVRDAAKKCFSNNGVPAALSQVELRHAGIDFSVLPNAATTVAAPVLTHFALTALTTPLTQIAARETVDWRPGLAVSPGSVINVTSDSRVKSATLALSLRCNGKLLTAVYASLAPLSQPLQETIPLSPDKACSNVIVDRVRARVQGHTGIGSGLRLVLSEPADRLSVAVDTHRTRIPIRIGRRIALNVSSGPIALEHSTAQPSIVALEYSRAPDRAPVAIPAATTLGFLHVAKVPRRVQTALLTDIQAYNPMWMALPLSHPFAPLRHVRVDGWHNGWWLHGGQAVLIFNAVDAMEALLMFVGLVVVLAAWKRAAWRR